MLRLLLSSVSSNLTLLLGILGGLLVDLDLGLLLSGLGLLGQQLETVNFTLLGMDGFHQHSLILELVALGTVVQFAIQMLINLLGSSVFAQQASEHSQSAHPENLEWHTGIHGTLSATIAGVSALGLGLHVSLVARLGVDHVGLADDEVVLNELSHLLTTVGLRNFIGLVGVHPDLSLAALKHGSSESLL